MKDLNKLFEIAKDSFEREFECYGLRRQEVPFEAEGDWMSHCSSIWDEGEETDDELDGVSALWLEKFESLDEAIETSKMYFGKHLAIIASDSYTYGQDENEVVLVEPTVIAIIA